jgi:hypothetical protein
VNWIWVVEWFRIELAPPVVRKLTGQGLGCKLATPTSPLRSNKLKVSKLVEQGVVKQEAANGPRWPLALSRRSEFCRGFTIENVASQADTRRENRVKIYVSPPADSNRSETSNSKASAAGEHLS